MRGGDEQKTSALLAEHSAHGSSLHERDMGFLYLRLLCVGRMFSISSQVHVNLPKTNCGSGCHLTEECWLRYGPREIIFVFIGSVRENGCVVCSRWSQGSPAPFTVFNFCYV